MIILYITAVLISIILERQERRHRFDESLEYMRMGKTMPEPKPKLPLLESWLFTVIGILVFVLCAGSVWVALQVMRMAPQLLTNPATGNDLVNQAMNWGAGMAAGIAVTILGFKSVRQNHRLKSQ